MAHLITVDLAGTPTAIATCHLESLLEDGPMRAEQLQVFFTALESFEEAFFAGDFNFGDGEEPETSTLPSSFSDAWLVTHPGKPGFTWDTTLSRMARASSFPGEPSRRLDRILYRSSRWSATQVTILGTSPVAGKRRHVFPSDHFGLLAEFVRAPGGLASSTRPVDRLDSDATPRSARSARGSGGGE